MAQISPEEMAALAAQAARGQTRTSTGPTSQLQQKIFGTTTQEEPVDPTWMGKTADWLTTGPGGGAFTAGVIGKSWGLNPEKGVGKRLMEKAPSLGQKLISPTSAVPRLLRMGLKRNPYSGALLALAPGALNLGEAAWQGVFGDKEAAGERGKQAFDTTLDELLYGVLPVAGIKRLAGLPDKIRRRMTPSTDWAPSILDQSPPASVVDDAADVTRPRPVSTDQHGPMPDVTPSNTWSRKTGMGVETDTWNQQSTARKPPPTPTDGATTRRTGDAVDDSQMKLDFDSKTYQPDQQARIWGANTKEVRHVRGLGEIVPIHAKRLGRETGEFLYTKVDGTPQFPPIQRISDPKSPKELVQRLEQILNVDGIRDIDLVASALRQDTLDPTTFEFVRKRLPPELAHALTGGGQDPWKALKRMLGEEVFTGTRADFPD